MFSIMKKQLLDTNYTKQKGMHEQLQSATAENTGNFKKYFSTFLIRSKIRV